MNKKKSCVELFLEKELKSIDFEFVKMSKRFQGKNLFKFELTEEIIDLIEELKKIPILDF